jgi:hypothetical protein
MSNRERGNFEGAIQHIWQMGNNREWNDKWGHMIITLVWMSNNEVSGNYLFALRGVIFYNFLQYSAWTNLGARLQLLLVKFKSFQRTNGFQKTLKSRD